LPPLLSRPRCGSSTSFQPAHPMVLPRADKNASSIPVQGHYPRDYVTTYHQHHLIEPQISVETSGGEARDHGHLRGVWPLPRATQEIKSIAAASSTVPIRTAGAAVVASTTPRKLVLGKLCTVPPQPPDSARSRTLGGSLYGNGGILTFPPLKDEVVEMSNFMVTPQSAKQYSSGRFSPRCRHRPCRDMRPVEPKDMIVRDPVDGSKKWH